MRSIFYSIKIKIKSILLHLNTYSLAAKYAKKIGFTAPLMLEPKPREPSKEQYDFDAATTHAFLLSHGLDKLKQFQLNIE